jgi:adenosylcobinamide-GDP ribazoletransferase
LGFFIALKFLTVFPGPEPKEMKDSLFGRSLAYFPLVGLLLGGVLFGLYYGLMYILPEQLVTILTLLALAIMTGAHHLDGLADTFDGITGSKPRERRLEIMSDSRTGAIGVVAVIFLVIIKYVALLSAIDPLTALLLMTVLSRWVVVCAIFFFPYAKQAGMGLLFKQGVRWYTLVIATILSLTISLVLLQWWGIILTIALLLVVTGIAIFFNRRLGGLTGDCYGAIIELSEAITLISIIVISIWL